MVVTFIIPALRKLGHSGYLGFKASLEYRARPGLKKTKSKTILVSGCLFMFNKVCLHCSAKVALHVCQGNKNYP